MKLLITLACSIALVSCGQHPKADTKTPDTQSQLAADSDDEDSDSGDEVLARPNTPEALNPIVGTWVSNCYENHIFTKTYTADGTASSQQDIYDDTPNCAGTISLSLITTTTYVANGANLDSVLVTATAMLTAQADADSANAESIYGYTDWQANTPKDILDRYSFPDDDTSLILHTAENFYQIFMTTPSGNALYFGDTATLEGTTEDTRPIYYNTALVFMKQ